MKNIKETVMQFFAKYFPSWKALSDKARTGVLIVATLLLLWWLREVLAGAVQWLAAGAIIMLASGTIAYWTDRSMYRDSRPHEIPWSENPKARMFAETRRFAIFVLTVLVLTFWYRAAPIFAVS
ncbi:MAG: hypothetical protein LBE32_05650 [Burkholderiales bacterium]|jgi:hypothetical protein|nr:hypothetical protein [Burkholderiales bacterium]